MQTKLALSVRNNAEWCDAVCTAHGIPGAFATAIWTQPERGPPYYSNAITLTPSDHKTQRAAIAGLLTALPDGFSVKDSFRALDLSDLRFAPLFDAEWVWLDPAAAPKPPSKNQGQNPGQNPKWKRVRAEADLARWEAAWSAAGSPAAGRVFLPSLLGDDRIAFLGREDRGQFIAGCIANRTSGGVTGFSNFFAAGPERDRLRAEAVAEVARFAPGEPIVGYDRDDDLAGLVTLGFRAVGHLRVWLRQ